MQRNEIRYDRTQLQQLLERAQQGSLQRDELRECMAHLAQARATVETWGDAVAVAGGDPYTLLRRKQPSPPAEPHAPPAGFPSEPNAFVAVLAGPLTVEQVRALRAIEGQYASALANLRSTRPGTPQVAKGEEVLAAMQAALLRYADVEAGNPFNLVAP